MLSLDEIGFKLIEAMNRFKPFGMGNPKPLFFIENFLPQKVSFLGQGREHIKLEHHYGFKIFAFGMGEYYDIFASKKPFGVVVDISEDNWNGQK